MIVPKADNDYLKAIEFRHVSLSFDDTPALIDVSFQLDRGEMIFLTGASGSGKSVLLQLAIGLLKPDSGQIFVAGREIETLDESELLAVRGGLMGMVFQEDSLFTGLSVYDNAAYRPTEHGWSEEEIQKAVTEVLHFVGLDGEEEKLPEELSGGMKRRLEIARAMIGWPSIMLFDEPTMSLDPLVALQVLNLIIRARDINKISSLYVTKKLYELPYLAKYIALENHTDEILICEAPLEKLPKTKIIVLEAGRIAFTGSLAEFQASQLPAIKELLVLEQHPHRAGTYFADPWATSRQPQQRLF
ncbi:MAG TPA: ATP-binding cassette domain-containing protein [Pyrinomonadaceae bacterium]|nr:ATP-binding cassette domain-containing protein [Pyrinomonadaceae bacterium]